MPHGPKTIFIFVVHKIYYIELITKNPSFWEGKFYTKASLLMAGGAGAN